ncbi:MAG: ABC transporter permease [Thermoprotei archaeon]|nr:MAG: ABC transporter permease [Thermoprotei archaeon]RLF23035.1 MAG: ABC transporter permease [Thermoprotei archaeon]
MRKRGINPFIIFISRKIGFSLATYFIFLTIIFLVPRVIPGNPLATLLAKLYRQAQANPELIRESYRRLMEEFGVGRPLWEQYVDFVCRTFRGDLGTSISSYPCKVAEIIAMNLPWSLGLLIPALLISWTIGNLMGAWAAYRRQTAVDNVLLTVFIVLSQSPYYWLAMLLLYLFAVRMTLFPVGGTYSVGLIPTFSLRFIADYLQHLALPLFSIVLGALGGWAIGMRVLMIYEIESDYIVFSRTLGLPDKKLLSYAFRSSILPQVTGLATSFGTILGGSLITELVFNYQGMGMVLFRALLSLDYPLIQGIYVILALTFVLATMIVDFVYALIDPRIRTGYVGG